jgi:Domain of unknown function (DUF4411)
VSYLLDSDVLIQAKNRHYPFDVCPGFWDWLDTAHADGRVGSVARVYDEISGAGDQLAEWAKNRDSFWFDPDDSVLQSMRDVAAWVTSTNPPYTAAAIAEFLGAADYYLVSHARAHGFTVVTAEVTADTVKKVKIPNACLALNVSYTDVFTMLRVEGARFVMT